MAELSGMDLEMLLSLRFGLVPRLFHQRDTGDKDLNV